MRDEKGEMIMHELTNSTSSFWHMIQSDQILKSPKYNVAMRFLQQSHFPRMTSS